MVFASSNFDQEDSYPAWAGRTVLCLPHIEVPACSVKYLRFHRVCRRGRYREEVCRQVNQTVYFLLDYVMMPAISKLTIYFQFVLILKKGGEEFLFDFLKPILLLTSMLCDSGFALCCLQVRRRQCAK